MVCLVSETSKFLIEVVPRVYMYKTGNTLMQPGRLKLKKRCILISTGRVFVDTAQDASEKNSNTAIDIEI